MYISCGHVGGNVRVQGIVGDTVYIAPDLRDTNDPWFYWNFCVRGAQGRTLTFTFSYLAWVGPFGPAVSHDLLNWAWGGEVAEDCRSFTYSFGPEEDRVYFCHDLYYSPARFAYFAKELGLPVRPLTLSDKGHAVPIVEFGEGDQTLMLFSRHHCCESTGTHVMEGMLRELWERPVPGLAVAAVPFADIDGVIAGDQGKNRIPHDHNRDYIRQPLYSAIAAIKDYVHARKVVAAMDLHSPWHAGGRNDVCFIVRKNPARLERLIAFGKLFEAENAKDPEAFRYYTQNDLDPNTEWNQEGVMQASCGGFFAHHPDTRLSFTLETPYFGTPDNIATQESLGRLGRSLARALAWSATAS